MAFINDYTTEEERRLLASFKDDPKTTLAKDFDKNPFNFRHEISYWTVDGSKQTALICFGIDDRENPYEGERFSFLYGAFDRAHTISFVLKKDVFCGEKGRFYEKKYNAEDVVLWEIVGIKSKGEAIEVFDTGFFQTLSDAFGVYDLDGNPDEDVNPKRCKALIKHNGKIYGE